MSEVLLRRYVSIEITEKLDKEDLEAIFEKSNTKALESIIQDSEEGVLESEFPEFYGFTDQSEDAEVQDIDVNVDTTLIEKNG